MGGTGVALRGHDNALFLNPALLGAQQRTSCRVVDARLIFNQNTLAQYGFYRDRGRNPNR